MLHVWYIYLHLGHLWGKCWWIFHTWSIWEGITPVVFMSRFSSIRLSNNFRPIPLDMVHTGWGARGEMFVNVWTPWKVVRYMIYTPLYILYIICMSIHPSIHLSIYPSIHPSIHPSIYLSILCLFLNHSEIGVATPLAIVYGQTL